MHKHEYEYKYKEKNKELLFKKKAINDRLKLIIYPNTTASPDLNPAILPI